MQSNINGPITAKFLFIFMLIIVLFLPEAAYAQGTGGGGFLDSFTSLFDAVGEVLTTTWARAIGVIAVAVTGYLFFTGRLEMRWAVAVILGIIFVFGAPAIVDSIAAVL